MIKDNQQYFNRLHVIVDAFVIAGSYILAWYLKIGSNLKDTGPEVGVLDMKIYFSALYFVVPGYLILYYWFKLYSPKRVQRSESEIVNVCKANIVGVTVFLAVLFTVNNTFSSFQVHDFSRGMAAPFLFSEICKVCAVNTQTFLYCCYCYIILLSIRRHFYCFSHKPE